MPFLCLFLCFKLPAQPLHTLHAAVHANRNQLHSISFSCSYAWMTIKSLTTHQLKDLHCKIKIRVHTELEELQPSHPLHSPFILHHFLNWKYCKCFSRHFQPLDMQALHKTLPNNYMENGRQQQWQLHSRQQQRGDTVRRMHGGQHAGMGVRLSSEVWLTRGTKVC